ncbi:MAG: hypothetical protein QNI95_02925 [Desulfobacterales bacterium]|nr:hypothetical protein [Desulfobacterales bacterium]
MKTLRISILMILVGFWPGLILAQAPHQVGGFVLGKHISEYKEFLKMDSMMPMRNRTFIHEVEVAELEGYKSGLIWVGNCADPGRIVRIKLKYIDSSRKFYNELLKRYKKRFGEPSEWRGDPFHIVIAWKWSFVDANNKTISLILQHNTKDEEEKIGNSVKLTIWDLINEEQRCAEQKSADMQKSSRKKERGEKSKSIDWDRLIPQ